MLIASPVNQDYVAPMTKDNEPTTIKGERIAKALARAGIDSRRGVERLIEEGRVTLDGKTLDTPATLVSSLDGIRVNGEPVTQADQTRLWRFYKPAGMLTTHNDPQGRSTIFEHLPEHLPRVISVGRLDMNTEGLLLLTNDGELSRWLELPDNGIIRTYRVRAYGHVKKKQLASLKDGATIDGVHYGPIDASLERAEAANCWINVSIREGKNREVRRVMEYLGLTVNRLIRTNYGPFGIGTLKKQATAEVNSKQLHDVLKDFFSQRAGSIAAPDEKDHNRKKWAKAKPKKHKPGFKRRQQFNKDKDNDTICPSKSKRPRSR